MPSIKDQPAPKSYPTHAGVSITTAMKHRILMGAIQDRQNLIVPSTANDLKRLEADMDSLAAAGYLMHAVCMWAPVSETRARGEPRSVREGKRWTPENYAASVQSTCAIARKFILGALEGDSSPYATVALWDNTRFPAREVDLKEFERLSNLTNEAADEHAWECKRPKSTAGWGKIRKAAAAMKAFGGSFQRNRSIGTQTDLDAVVLSVDEIRQQQVRGRVEGCAAGVVLASVIWAVVVASVAALLSS